MLSIFPSHSVKVMEVQESARCWGEGYGEPCSTPHPQLQAGFGEISLLMHSSHFHISNLIRNSGCTANKASPSPNQPRASQGRNLGGSPGCPHRPCPFSACSLRKWPRKLLRSH